MTLIKKMDLVAIYIAGFSLLLSCVSVAIAVLSFLRDKSRLIVRPSIIQSPYPNENGKHDLALAVQIINHGRRKDKIKVLVLRTPGASPTLSYFYYLDAEGIADQIVDEADDILATVPFTPIIKEAIRKCREIYVINSADEVLRASRKSIKKLKKYTQDLEPIEIEDKEKSKVFRVKSPSRFFALLMGEEYRHHHFHINKNEEI